MHILILGATGRTGRLLVKEALKRGHHVSVVVGHKSSLKCNAELVDIHEGTPLNIYTLANAMRDCEAIMSTLNISRISDFPWSKLRTSKDFLSSSIQNVLTTAKEQHINRIIVTTAWGVAETRKDMPFWFRWLVDNSNIKYAYRDHARQEEMLKLSGTKWTIIRPVGLTDSEKNRKVKVTLHNSRKPSFTISRRNVAHFMLDVLEKDLYIRECPVISEKK
jgi:putative NADH-flavin reductase